MANIALTLTIPEDAAALISDVLFDYRGRYDDEQAVWEVATEFARQFDSVMEKAAEVAHAQSFASESREPSIRKTEYVFHYFETGSPSIEGLQEAGAIEILKEDTEEARKAIHVVDNGPVIEVQDYGDRDYVYVWEWVEFATYEVRRST